MPTLKTHLCPPQAAVQVKLELGHRAQVRRKATAEGFTHDWMVFVRGPAHGNIEHFVDKVVFHLHDSFPRPKRGEAAVVAMVTASLGVLTESARKLLDGKIKRSRSKRRD